MSFLGGWFQSKLEESGGRDAAKDYPIIEGIGVTAGWLVIITFLYFFGSGDKKVWLHFATIFFSIVLIIFLFFLKISKLGWSWYIAAPAILILITAIITATYKYINAVS